MFMKCVFCVFCETIYADAYADAKGINANVCMWCDL